MSTRPLPEALLAVLLCGAAAAHAADALDLRAERERQRFDNERARVEAQYAARVRQCEGQFIVTSCVDEAKARRRQALESLAQQQGVIDDAMRKQRAAERLETLQERQREAALKRSATQPRVVQRKAGAPASAPSAAAPAAHGSPPSPASVLSHEAPSAGQRRQNAAAYEARQKAAEEHREAVEKRNAQHDAGRKPVAPLPVPATIAPASAPASGR